MTLAYAFQNGATLRAWYIGKEERYCGVLTIGHHTLEGSYTLDDGGLSALLRWAAQCDAKTGKNGTRIQTGTRGC